MSRTDRQQGFTIIELIFATLIFTMVMTVILVSAFQIGRIYYKGVSISNTNEAARTVISDLTNDIKFAGPQGVTTVDPGGPFSPGSNIHYFCIGLHRYAFVQYKKVTNDDISRQNLTGIRQDTVSSGCPDPSKSGKDAIQLLGPDMQLNNADLIACANGACTVHLHIIFYGTDNRVFASASVGTVQNDPASPGYDADQQPDSVCTGNLLSSQFCAAIDLQTVILQNE